MLESLGLLEGRTVAAHGVWLSDDDITLLARRGVSVSHNPESNMKLASGVAPLPEMLGAGVKVGLGTDGCASNNNLDMLQEMDTAAKLQKVHRLDPTALPATAALDLATRGSARARRSAFHRSRRNPATGRSRLSAVPCGPRDCRPRPTARVPGRTGDRRAVPLPRLAR